MQTQIEEIRARLAANSKESIVASQQKFLPGITLVYGVSMPVLNDLAKEFKSGGFDLVEELGKSDYFEERMLAAKLLGKIAKKDPGRTLSLFKKLSRQIDNWALCDTLGMQSLKPLANSQVKEIFELANRYNKSDNPWLRRLSLVMAEWYTRDKKYHAEIRKLINHLKEDKEYYVKKAVDWLERNLNKGK